jgi:hypothetical protein
VSKNPVSAKHFLCGQLNCEEAAGLPYPYMIGGENPLNYQTAFDFATRSLAACAPLVIAGNSGAEFDARRSVLTLDTLGQVVEVQYPGGEIYFRGSDLRPTWEWRLIIITYLARADGAPVSGCLCSYRETGGQVFYPAFVSGYLDPLVKELGPVAPQYINDACLALGGTLDKGADVSARFPMFPRFPVTFRFWLPDEELGASANILFDETAGHYLDSEVIAASAGLLSNFIIQQIRL